MKKNNRYSYVAIAIGIFLLGCLLIYRALQKDVMDVIEDKPSLKLAGLGLDRKGMSETVLAERARRKVESETFSIMRHPQAVLGAQRITGEGLQRMFDSAAIKYGFSKPTLEAIAYLESWGVADAVSPTGPRGIMQFTEGTARTAGLQIVRQTRHKTVYERKQVGRSKKTKKPIFRRVARKVPYVVTVLDERMDPAKAIEAAARYLSGLTARFGRQDLAVFAYHCGERCVGEFIRMVQGKKDFQGGATVPRLFFLNSPVYNRDLYEALDHHLRRDYSPTYWFRVTCAENLLSLYRYNPSAFYRLAKDYANKAVPDEMAPSRMWAWYSPQDVLYKELSDLEAGKGLVMVPNDPDRYHYTLRTEGAGAIGEREPDAKNKKLFLQNSPTAVGALMYVAAETKRLFDELKPKGEKFEPLSVTALVRCLSYQKTLGGNAVTALPTHCLGAAFDISYKNMKPGQKECLEFVLRDMGWDEYIGYVVESVAAQTYHVVPAPSQQKFFTDFYREATK